MEFTDLSVTLKGKSVLRNVSGKVQRSLAIMGPSGAGKTTLLNVLAGKTSRNETTEIFGTFRIPLALRRHGAGSVSSPVMGRHGQHDGGQAAGLQTDRPEAEIDEIEAAAYAYTRWMDHISFVEQYDTFMREVTVMEHLLFHASLRLHSVGVPERTRRIQKIMKRLRLTSCRDTMVTKCSGGQKKRISIAEEMLVEPRILVLDEPTSGLDSTVAREVMDIILNKSMVETDENHSVKPNQADSKPNEVDTKLGEADVVDKPNGGPVGNGGPVDGDPNGEPVDSKPNGGPLDEANVDEMKEYMSPSKRAAQQSIGGKKTDSTLIIFTIHQPSSTIFDWFDDVMILGSQGRLLYNGPAKEMCSRFSKINWEFPRGFGECEYVLDLAQNEEAMAALSYVKPGPDKTPTDKKTPPDKSPTGAPSSTAVSAAVEASVDAATKHRVLRPLAVESEDAVSSCQLFRRSTTVADVKDNMVATTRYAPMWTEVRELAVREATSNFRTPMQLVTISLSMFIVALLQIAAYSPVGRDTDKVSARIASTGFVMSILINLPVGLKAREMVRSKPLITREYITKRLYRIQSLFLAFFLGQLVLPFLQLNMLFSVLYFGMVLRPYEQPDLLFKYWAICTTLLTLLYFGAVFIGTMIGAFVPRESVTFSYQLPIVIPLMMIGGTMGKGVEIQTDALKWIAKVDPFYYSTKAFQVAFYKQLEFKNNKPDGVPVTPELILSNWYIEPEDITYEFIFSNALIYILVCAPCFLIGYIKFIAIYQNGDYIPGCTPFCREFKKPFNFVTKIIGKICTRKYKKISPQTTPTDDDDGDEKTAAVVDVPNLRREDESEGTRLPGIQKTVSMKMRSQALPLKWDDLEVWYQDKKLLDNITGEIHAGSNLAIVGPSGAGKTTLLNVLGGKQRAGGDWKMKGTITIGNETMPAEEYGLTKDSLALLNNVSFVEQYDLFIDQLTVFEHLMFHASLRCFELTHVEKVRRVERILKRLRLEVCRDNVCMRCSGGQKKRISIGEELLVAPSILLLDEPTSGLDSTVAREVMEILLSPQTNSSNDTTIAFTIHQPSAFIASMFEDILVLARGSEVYWGHANRLLDRTEKAVGQKCPAGYEGVEFVLDVVQDDSIAERILVEGIRRDTKHADRLKGVDQLLAKKNLEKLMAKKMTKKKPTFLYECHVCGVRQYLNERRNPDHELRVWSYFTMWLVICICLIGGSGDLKSLSSMQAITLYVFFLPSLMEFFFSMFNMVMAAPSVAREFLTKRLFRISSFYWGRTLYCEIPSFIVPLSWVWYFYPLQRYFWRTYPDLSEDLHPSILTQFEEDFFVFDWGLWISKLVSFYVILCFNTFFAHSIGFFMGSLTTDIRQLLIMALGPATFAMSTTVAMSQGRLYINPWWRDWWPKINPFEYLARILYFWAFDDNNLFATFDSEGQFDSFLKDIGRYETPIISCFRKSTGAAIAPGSSTAIVVPIINTTSSSAATDRICFLRGKDMLRGVFGYDLYENENLGYEAIAICVGYVCLFRFMAYVRFHVRYVCNNSWKVFAKQLLRIPTDKRFSSEKKAGDSVEAEKIVLEEEDKGVKTTSPSESSNNASGDLLQLAEKEVVVLGSVSPQLSEGNMSQSLIREINEVPESTMSGRLKKKLLEEANS